MNIADDDRAFLRTLTLLYVEDVGVIRERIRKILEPMVGKLILAKSGAAGLEAFRDHHPQIVVTDIVMPDGDGLGMAQALRAQDPLLPIIVTTAFDNTDFLIRSIELGVEKYVFKPVDPQELKEALLKCARRLSAEKELLCRRQLDSAQLRIQHQVAMGALAQGMGHDFNNLLQGVMGAISVAKFSMSATHPLHGVLALAEQSCQQARQLGHRLMTLAKGYGPLENAGSLGPILRAQVEPALRGTAIAFHFDLPEELPWVKFDEQDIQTLIGILVANAQDAMPSGGTLAILARPCAVTEKDALDLPSGAYVRHTFQDSGSGISPEFLPRVFEPYFTTKSVKNKKGVGLSLAIAQAIARSHGGLLTVESPAGEGAAFRLYLPVS